MEIHAHTTVPVLDSGLFHRFPAERVPGWRAFPRPGSIVGFVIGSPAVQRPIRRAGMGEL